MSTTSRTAGEITTAWLSDDADEWSSKPKFERRNLSVVAAITMSAFCTVASFASVGLEHRPGFPVLQRLAQGATAPAAMPPPDQSETKPNLGAPAPAPPPSVTLTNWQQSLVAHIERFKRYPAQARGATGAVSLAFRIDRKGRVLSSRILKSSGSADLDAETLALIRRAAPLPPPPTEITDDQLSFIVPIRYGAGDER